MLKDVMKMLQWASWFVTRRLLCWRGWVPNNIINNISNSKQQLHTGIQNLRRKLFSLKIKTTGQTLNNFTIIKSITIILVCLTAKEKMSLIFFTLTQTNYLSQKWQHFALSLLFSSLLTALFLGCLLSLRNSLLTAFLFFFLLCGTFFSSLALFFSLCVFFFLAHACLLYAKETSAALHS